MYADSHCHLQFIDYAKLNSNISTVVENSITHGVNYLLCAATHLDQVAELYLIAEKFSNVKISIGLHPTETAAKEPNFEDYLVAQVHPAVVAIGETGLDYYRTKDDILQQQNRFKLQIRAAKHCNKPLIIHSRNAKQDTLNILRQENAASVGGVLHCFTEDLDMALQAIDLNFYISFSGIVTFANAVDLQKIAQELPLDKILLETDAPYLAPIPLRGQINQPANVQYIAEFIAKLRGIDVRTLAEQTTQNYCALFKI